MDAIGDRRIYRHPEWAFDRGYPIHIRFEGKRIRAFSNEPVAVAMMAAGVPVTMRSFKFHRPRGPFCLAGKCASCLVRIDGVPNCKACRITCRDEMVVQRQAGFPTASDDALFANDFLFRKKLDYHHMMTSPQWLNNLAAFAIRQFSGIGDLPDDPPKTESTISDCECDVAVIGGGPAGIEAALAAHTAGASVVLVDDRPHVGGHLLSWPDALDDTDTGQSYCAEATALLAESDIRVLSDTECVGFYEEGFFACANENGLVCLHPKRTVLATGGYDQNMLFAQNDLPNIISVRALASLVVRWGVRPADRIFFLGSGDMVPMLAMRLREMDVEIAGIAEQGETLRSDPERFEAIRMHGTPVLTRHVPESALGRFALRGVKLRDAYGGTKSTRCDMIVVDAPLSPTYELAAQVGAALKFAPDAGGYIPEHDHTGRSSVESVFVAGEICGQGAPAQLRKQGRIAGIAAALDLYDNDKTRESLARELE